MQHLDQREWLITNGLGSYASGTVCDARTRTYHGWLVAALNPPTERTLLLSHLEATLVIDGLAHNLGTNFWADGLVIPKGYCYLESFSLEPVPTWLWREKTWQLQRQICLPHGQQQVLIHYQYQGSELGTLHLRPLIGDRNFHHQQNARDGWCFSQLVGKQQVSFQAIAPRLGTAWNLWWSQGEYRQESYWYWRYFYPEEQRRGLAYQEDLYNPGCLTVNLLPGDSLTIQAGLGPPQDFAQALAAEGDRQEKIFVATGLPNTAIHRQLVKAADQFIVYRSSTKGPTVIAGYHWFNDWGRDTLIALPGLTLTTHRFEIAKGLLATFAAHCQRGLIANTFPDGGQQPSYNSLDAALWWIETLGLYLNATQDWQFLEEQYPTARSIYKALVGGTDYNIRVDAIDGLITWDAPGVAITWMDAIVNGIPVTPRRGKVIEINALWYSALGWLHQWADKLSLENQQTIYWQKLQQVQHSLQKFWNHEQGYLYDVIAPDDRLDRQIRANAVIALSLSHCAFSAEQGRTILKLAEHQLLTPYGLRSLAPSERHYLGHYSGDSYYRDRAYHQGTVWTWLLGPFLRAWRHFYPESPLNFDWQPLWEHLHQQACLGSVSEIFDGNFPHSPQGAIAQAWSVAEILREYSQD